MSQGVCRIIIKLGIHVRIPILKMHDTLARAPRTPLLSATGDGAVNCFVFALDEVTGYKLKAAESDIKK